MKYVLSLMLVLGITFFSFSPALNNQFVNWDDPEHFLENPNVQFLTGDNTARIFRGNGVNAYRPLTILSFAIEHHFFGFNSFIYHLDNILLHLGVICFVFIFALQTGLSTSAAVLAALLFGIHPMRVESVAWVTERKDVLYAFFYMAALVQYWRYLGNQKKLTYLSTIFLGFLSMLSKPMALSLPAVFFICDWFYNRKFTLRVFIEKIPYVVYIVPLLLITTGAYTFDTKTGVGEGILAWVWSFIFYLKKFVWPMTLVPLYDLPVPVSLLTPPFTAALVLFSLFLVLTFRLKTNRWWLFSVLFYFVSIACLLKYHGEDPNVVADRYMYLPSLGFCLLFGYVCGKILEAAGRQSLIARRCILVLLIGIFSLLSFKTYQQTKVWQNSFSLWNHVLTCFPDNPIALNNRGSIYKEGGQDQLALSDFNRALAIDSGHVSALYNRGTMYERLGDDDLALADYDRVLQLDPETGVAYRSRGALYFRRGDRRSAFSDLTEAVKIDPDNINFLKARGNAYATIGRFDLALKDYNHALWRWPDNAELYNNRGIVFSDIGQNQWALADFNKAIQLKPQKAIFYYNRSMLFNDLNQYSRALEDVLKAQGLGLKSREGYIKKLQRMVAAPANNE